MVSLKESTAQGAVLERGRPVEPAFLERKADWIRAETVRLIDGAGLGHYSSTFSCAEILSTLYYHVLRLCPSEPAWADRDRFLLSKGHVAVGLWPVLADLGYFPPSELDQFGQLGSPINDHPSMRTGVGIDFSSGALGHNLSVSVGIALAGKLQGRDYRTFVVTGDGELQEGQMWEAFMAGSHYGLGGLVAIVDANGFSGAGPTSEAMSIEPLAERAASFGWEVTELDGHDVIALSSCFDALPPASSDRPTCVIARTQKGKGLEMMEKAPQSWHLGLLTPEQRDAALAEIGERLS